MKTYFSIFTRAFSLSALRVKYVQNDFGEKTLEYLRLQFSKQEEDLTIIELKNRLLKRLGATLWLDRQSRAEKIKTYKKSSKLREEAFQSPRKITDSFSSAIIPFGKNKELRDRYVTFLGKVRYGRLMEDLDMFAVWVAAEHISPRSDLEGDLEMMGCNIVTLLVDSIDFVDTPLEITRDLRLTGFVSWCSRSTLETELWLEEINDNNWKVFGHARFVMALRDALTNTAAAVNPLVASDLFEEELLEKAIARRKQKRAMESLSLYIAGPQPSESKHLHDIVIEKVIDVEAPPYHSLETSSTTQIIRQSRLTAIEVCHPDNRNMYNTIFGGYLMRLAVEVSWQGIWLRLGKAAQLIFMGDIRFIRPVEVASMLQMDAYIVYSEGTDVVSKVVAFVSEPQSGKVYRCNDFHFVYRLKDPGKHMVLPYSYEDALMYLEGRRRLKVVEELSKYVIS